MVQQRNYYVSYLKGFAIITAILIHLMDWSNIMISPTDKIVREVLHVAVLFFIATVGMVIFIAYHHYENLWKPTKRLWIRGVQLIGMYYAYNIVKLFVFDFQKEPFYGQFIEKGVLDVYHILTLQSFTVPISIIWTIGIFLLISPFFLWIAKKTTYPKSIIGGCALIIFLMNYVFPHLDNGVSHFLYAQGNVTFPILLWMFPYLLGLLLAMMGLEKQKKKGLLFFGSLTIIFGVMQWQQNQSLWITDYMYPLQPYYITASFFVMYGLIYIFSWLETIQFSLTQYILAVIRLLGDSTLSLYLYHWVIVDISLYIFYPNTKSIWWTVSFFLIVFLFLKRKLIQQYVLDHKQHILEKLRNSL